MDVRFASSTCFVITTKVKKSEAREIGESEELGTIKARTDNGTMKDKTMQE